MGGLLSAALLVPLLCAAPGEPAQPRRGALETELRAAARRLAPLAEELRNLSGSYRPGGDIEAALSRRPSLRQEVHALIQAIQRLLEEHDQVAAAPRTPGSQEFRREARRMIDRVRRLGAAEEGEYNGYMRRRGKAPSPAAPAASRADRLEAQMRAIASELVPLVDQLQELADGYRLGTDLEPALARRPGLRQAVQERMEAFVRLNDEHDQVSAASQIAGVAAMMSTYTGDGKLPDGAGMAYIEYSRRQEFRREARGVMDRTWRVQDAEEGEYKAYMQRLEETRAWRLLAGGLAGLLLLVVAALLLWRRREPPAQTLTGALLPPPAGPVAALPPPSEAGPGTVLGGNYRVERVLGRGGMGVVYEAVDLTLQRKVAIKRMTDDLVKAGHDLELFVNEARLVAQLKHPNIVEIHSILREAGLLHLVFEYVEGKALSDYLGRENRVSLHSAKGVVKQVASALDYAHSRKVIHRDLKPANVMILRGGAVKVMDFGIAHQAKMTVAKATRTGAWGTPPYMAPEQELGQVSRESDLFALGVCLYEMLTGRVPYTGPNFLAQKRERVYSPASASASDLPKGLDAFLHQALSPDPKERFHSGADFSAALDSVS